MAFFDTSAMSDNLLSPFHIRNLNSPNEASADQLALVRISAPGYDKTISDNPAATLKYEDEEHDTIVLGSSRELIEKLNEPVRQPSTGSTWKNKDRMSIAMLLSQQNPQATLSQHVFTIDERDEIKKLWRQIQRGSSIPKSVSPVPSPPFGWSPADAALLARYCDSGMDLENVITRMRYRSRQSCRWYYQNHMDNKKMENESKKKRVAMAYARLRKFIWMSVAAQVGMPWEEVESMHWAMGRDEMKIRGQDAVLFEETSPVDLMSVESTDGDWHENRLPKAPTRLPQHSTPTLEDYRKHYFNTTMPPQLKFSTPPASAFSVESSKLKTTAALPMMNPTLAVNLTPEGKRQAQAAGEILRARTMSSRHRKAAMNVNDHTNHQNRWAGYKPSETPSSKFFSDMPQNTQKLTLTPEGRRQAQAAGDKLRCRTNPIRHSRPSRSGSLENGINKNRWSSYAPRTVRFEDRHHVDMEAKVTTKSDDMKAKTPEDSPTLLQVFEAELAKRPLGENDSYDEPQFPDPDVGDIPPTVEPTARAEKVKIETSTPTSSAPLDQPPNAVFDGFKMISDHLQRLTGGNPNAPQDFSQVLENGLRTAAGGFEGFLRGLTGGLQEISDHAQQAADRTRELDTQGINNTIKDLQDIVVGLSDGLISTEVTSSKNSPSTTDQQTSLTHPVHAGNKKSSTSPVGSSNDSDQRQVQHVIDINSTEETKGRKGVNGSDLDFKPEITQAKSDFSYDHRDTMSTSPNHRPKLMHPSQHATTSGASSRNANDIPAVGPKSTVPSYVDHLRRLQTSQSLGNACPSPAAFRFPTLAQFEEGQRSASQSKSPSSFPALPTMQPLIPQQPSLQEYEKQLEFLEKHDIRKSHSYARGTSPPRVQPTSHRRDQKITDYQAQLEPLERQNKTRILMARQEEDAVYSKSLAHIRIPNKFKGTASTDITGHPALQTQPLADSHGATAQNLTIKHIATSPATSLQGLKDLNQVDFQEKQSPSIPQEHDIFLKDHGPETESSDERAVDELSGNGASATSLAAPQENPDDHDQVREGGPSSARLAGPFDPLDVEPSARVHLTEEVRRSNTLAGTGSRHEFPRRRPYSEAYDGRGRLPWDAFLGPNRQDGQSSPKKTCISLMKRQENARKARENDRQHRKQEQLRRSATMHNPTSRSTPAFQIHEDERQDDLVMGATLRKGANRSTPVLRPGGDGQQLGSTVGAIERCVDQLQDLGFGDDGSRDRLLVYAQAAHGDLVEAIDIIDEEQRVYQEMS